MSLNRLATGSPLSASFPTPSDSDQWLAQDFADDLFGGASDLGHALSGMGLLAHSLKQPATIRLTCCAFAADDKLFELQGSDSFPDALSELDNLPDQPNDRQVPCQPYATWCP